MPLMPHTLQSHLLYYNRLQTTSRHDWRMLCEAVLLSDVGRVHAQDYSLKSCDGMATMLPAVLLYMCPAHFNVHALRVAFRSK